MNQQSAISIRNLSHWYGADDARRQALQSVSLDVAAGEVIFLMGPSGCGKTTVLTLVGGLRSVQRGSVSVCGQELNGAGKNELLQNRRNIGFVFQHHNLHRSLSVIDNVFMGLEATGQSGDADAFDRCRYILETVGLSDHLDKRQDQISGGQKQRVAIARALVSHPKIILADEPTAALDSHTGLEIVSLMHRLAKGSGTSVLIVTHDDRIFKFADRIVRMEDGRILEEGAIQQTRSDSIGEKTGENERTTASADNVRKFVVPTGAWGRAKF